MSQANMYLPDPPYVSLLPAQPASKFAELHDTAAGDGHLFLDWIDSHQPKCMLFLEVPTHPLLHTCFITSAWKRVCMHGDLS